MEWCTDAGRAEVPHLRLRVGGGARFEDDGYTSAWAPLITSRPCYHRPHTTRPIYLFSRHSLSGRFQHDGYTSVWAALIVRRRCYHRPHTTRPIYLFSRHSHFGRFQFSGYASGRVGYLSYAIVSATSDPGRCFPGRSDRATPIGRVRSRRPRAACRLPAGRRRATRWTR